MPKLRATWVNDLSPRVASLTASRLNSRSNFLLGADIMWTSWDQSYCLFSLSTNSGEGHIARIQVSEMDAGPSCDILIGMDLITLGDFAITNKDGQTMFSFRHPSLGHIDFEAFGTMDGSVQRVGRNALCPCGSG